MKYIVFAAAAAGLAVEAVAAPAPEAVERAVYDGGALPEAQSPLTMRVQILLDRAGVSPGVIDGWKGGMTTSAIRALEAREGLPVDGRMDQQVWRALGGATSSGLIQRYTITQADTENISDPLPEDYAQLAQLDWLGFTSVAEKLAERFHMDEDVFREMNAGAAFSVGETVVAAAPGPALEDSVRRIEVRKDGSRLAAFDQEGRMVANYPVVVGSAQTPSPSGRHEVVGIAVEPTYTYRPDVNFQQGGNDETLVLPPGPNGPVGLVWIDLSEPTYGIHGTGEPAKLFAQQSHGCVRMTNWDALELAEMVEHGVVVDFVE